MIGPGVSVDSVRVVTPAFRTLLEGVPDYILLLDSTGRTLYSSFAVRQLDADAQLEVSQDAARLRTDEVPRLVYLADHELLLAAAAPTVHGAVARVVGGLDAAVAGEGARNLLGPGLVLALPLIILSVLGAHMIAGRAFKPVDVIINEVEAITDGRSLHRRLAVEGVGDELRRLSETLNEMIARLETSFGALRRFTADASHELKTPLTVLRADVERAMTVGPHSSEQPIALEEALQETRRMADLVDSLLTLARADEGRYDILREPVDLEPLAREVYESAVILGEDAGLTVSLPVIEPATVLGDAPRLRQLFMNLVMNAIKYTPSGGRIDISLSHRLEGVTFTVRDTGVGIAASDLPHIFERFWRADRVRSRASERGGFGLGLAISQWIAQAHGGTISASSRLGRGSVFTVQLPLAADQPATSQSAGPTAAVAGAQT
jgi:signal transduction histidine kinase